MKQKGIFCGELTPIQKRKRNRLHTAVRKRIAVFFYSTNFIDFLLSVPLYPEFQQRNAFAQQRVRFLFVGKCQTPKYSICFQYGQALYHRKTTLFHELYTYYGLDKLLFVLSPLLFGWQAFIGRYP